MDEVWLGEVSNLLFVHSQGRCAGVLDGKPLWCPRTIFAVFPAYRLLMEAQGLGAGCPPGVSQPYGLCPFGMYATVGGNLNEARQLLESMTSAFPRYELHIPALVSRLVLVFSGWYLIPPKVSHSV